MCNRVISSTVIHPHSYDFRLGYNPLISIVSFGQLVEGQHRDSFEILTKELFFQVKTSSLLSRSMEGAERWKFRFADFWPDIPYRTELCHLLSLLYPLKKKKKKLFLLVSNKGINVEHPAWFPSLLVAPVEELLQLLDFCLPPWLVGGLWERTGFENSLSPWYQSTPPYSGLWLLSIKLRRSPEAFVKSEMLTLCLRIIFAHFQVCCSQLPCSLLFLVYTKRRPHLHFLWENSFFWKAVAGLILENCYE